jgi:CheY-like chemotaxis protein
MAKILVIHDEQGIRDLLDTLLSGKGYDVILSDSGERAWRFFAEHVLMSWCLI